MAYRILAWFLRVVTRVFFRQIEVVGLEHVPKDGPVLFAGNHPNSLIDPILIITTCGRKVHFAAKDALFKGRIMRAVLRGLGAVPIKRRDDHDGTRESSSGMPPALPDATAKMLGESALCLAYDQLPASGGCLTPSVAMNGALLDRLRKAGLTFQAG